MVLVLTLIASPLRRWKRRTGQGRRRHRIKEQWDIFTYTQHTRVRNSTHMHSFYRHCGELSVNGVSGTVALCVVKEVCVYV